MTIVGLSDSLLRKSYRSNNGFVHREDFASHDAVPAGERFASMYEQPEEPRVLAPTSNGHRDRTRSIVEIAGG